VPRGRLKTVRGSTPCAGLEGLKLLRDAWDDYDVAMRYAERYKAVAILSFVGLFALSIAAVVVISLSPELAKGVSEATADTIGDNTDMAAFLLSSASGLLLSVIGLLNVRPASSEAPTLGPSALGCGNAVRWL
jgi:uncharacterized membrane protein YiaA